MKCSRCGEECKDNQVFCLKCGTLIQVVPDFNLIEAELANNVGELMKEDNKLSDESDDMDYLDDEVYLVDTFDTRNTSANLVDIENYDKKMKSNSFEVDSSDFSSAKTTENNMSISKKQDIEIQREKKMFKVKAVVFSFVGIIIILIAGILLSVLNKGDKSKDPFKDLCNKGYDCFASKDYEGALNYYLDAKDIADADSEKIKVNKNILSCYEEMENKDAEIIDILKQLISLEHSKTEYYKKIVEIYEKNNMYDEITALIEGIEDSSIKAALSEYTVSPPQCNHKSGEYDEAISIKFTTGVKNKIYYTIDGTNPTVSSTEYTDEIKISENGETVVKAIAVNDSGITSKVAEYTFEIDLAVIEGPVVSPSDNSEYNSPQEITVEVPEGMKCYYTYGSEAKVPNEKDKEYTEPVKMMRGKNYFTAILVSEKGSVSEPTQKYYSLNRVHDYDSALNILIQYFVDNKMGNKVNDSELVNGDKTIKFEYITITTVDNAEYWVIDAVYNDTSGSMVNRVTYGIDTVSGLTDGKPVELVKKPDGSNEYAINIS